MGPLETNRLLNAFEAIALALGKIAARMPRQAAETVLDVPAADDDELDSQYGDPEIKYMLKRGQDDKHIGMRMSECGPAYLRAVYASRITYINYLLQQEVPDEKKITYAKKDAARALGWAIRKETGKPPIQAARASGDSGTPTEHEELKRNGYVADRDDEIPF